MEILRMTVTPEMAGKWLENNPANRNQRRFAIDAMARDMAAGRWQFNGDAIRMNCDGSLIDGQHRLSACVKANVPFDTIVITGLPNDARATIDGGMKRSHADRLAMRGFVSSAALSSAAKIIGALANGITNKSYTDQELDLIIARHPGLVDSVRKSYSVAKTVGRVSNYAALHYIGVATKNEVLADAFIRVLHDGVPAWTDDPARALRERIMRAGMTGEKLGKLDQLRLSVTAWNAFQVGRSLKVIRPTENMNIKGWTPEALGL